MDDLKYLCTILEVQYLEKNEPLPIRWYESFNYKLKLHLLAQALKKEVSVTEIFGFAKIIEESDNL